MVGYFEDEEGSRSMGRLLAFIAMLAGVVVMLAGVVAFVYLTCFAPIERAVALPQVLALLGLGAGIIGSSELLKAASKKLEV